MYEAQENVCEEATNRDYKAPSTSDSSGFVLSEQWNHPPNTVSSVVGAAPSAPIQTFMERHNSKPLAANHFNQDIMQHFNTTSNEMTAIRPMAKNVIVAIERPFTNELYMLHPFNVYTPRAYDLLLHDCSNRLRVQVSQIYSIRVRLASGMYHTINSCESMFVLSDMSILVVTCYGDHY
jgi:hypothetical protein